jgi:hypothetical protein
MKKHNARSARDDDWFAKGLRERVPAEVRDSFTAEQLNALKIAFGARRWGTHPVDLRGTFNLWRWRYYFVILLGRNARSLSRSERALSRTGNALVIACLSLIVLLAVLGLLYVLKSALGINIMPNASLGLWDWLRAR